MPARKAAKEKDYLALAKQKITTPKAAATHPRVLVYARNKIGKSRFGFSAGVDKTLILDPEHGTDRFVRLNPFVWHITRWEDLDEAWGALRTGELSPRLLKGSKFTDEPFEWVSVDGLTKINNLALNFVRKREEQIHLDRRPGFVDRRDYNKSGELMKQMLVNFTSLKMGVVFSAQQRMITTDMGDEEDDEVSTYFVPDVPASVRGSVNSIVDVIGRLYITPVTLKSGKEIKQRRLFIGTHDRYDTGYRSDYEGLPDFVKNPTIPKLVNLLVTGNEKGAAA